MHKDDFPGLQPGDIVEIYHPENEVLNDNGEIKVPRLMLMISKASIYPDNELQKPLNRETVNLEKSVAETFQLPNYRQYMILSSSNDYLQSWTFAYIRLLNNPYVNGVTLRNQTNFKNTAGLLNLATFLKGD